MSRSVKRDSYLSIATSFKSEFDSKTVNEVMKNGDRTLYEEKLTGYATDFLSNAAKI